MNTNLLQIVGRTCVLRRFLHKGAGKTKTPFAGDEVLVPATPYNSQIDEKELSQVPEFNEKLISHLERLSLLRFDSEQAVAHLRNSVRVAQRLELVDTEGIENMHTVWEEQECPLFDDVEDHSTLELNEVFQNAAKRYDDYFVTPPGNVPLESKERFNLKLINEWDRIGKPQAPSVKSTKFAENQK